MHRLFFRILWAILSCVMVVAMLSAAKPYLPRPIGGFAVETIGAGRQFIQKNFDGLIQVYPLSCMPEIVADGILSGMQQEYNMPVLRLIIDEHSGRAGNQTRIEAFADMLKQRKKMNGEKQKTKENNRRESA